MLTSEQFEERLADWETAVLSTAPGDFRMKVARYWFTEIAPERNEEYGVVCWQRYGVKGLLPQILAKHCRWEQNPGNLDTIRDLFGYSIILAIFTGITPDLIDWRFIWDEHSVSAFHERIVQVWEDPGDDLHRRVGSWSLAMVYGMWRKIP